MLELFTIFVLVLLLLLEGPKMRTALLGSMDPERAERYRRIAHEVNRSVTGYMLGNVLTSVIAGVVVFVTLLVTGVPFPYLWALWVALVDFLPMIGGALAGIPTVLFAAAHSLTAGIVTLVVFLIYTQLENHVLNPIVMSRTVRVNPLLVLLSILVGGEIGSWIGGIFGAFVGALLAIPAAGALQVIVREIWQATDPVVAAAGVAGQAVDATADMADEASEGPDAAPGASPGGDGRTLTAPTADGPKWRPTATASPGRRPGPAGGPPLLPALTRLRRCIPPGPSVTLITAAATFPVFRARRCPVSTDCRAPFTGRVTAGVAGRETGCGAAGSGKRGHGGDAEAPARDRRGPAPGPRRGDGRVHEVPDPDGPAARADAAGLRRPGPRRAGLGDR